MNEHDDIADVYQVPNYHPRGVAHPVNVAAFVKTMNEHKHLVDNEVSIDYLMRVDEKVKAGRQVLGTVYMPIVQGELRDMFEWLLSKLLGQLPEFLVVLDLAYWNKATAIEREILMFHELSHIKQKVDKYGALRFDKDGNPSYGLRGHDVEEFTAVVARYGAHNPDIQEFITAANRAIAP